jgi:hypothetical protein
MPTILTPLTSTNGFTSGDLNTDGYISVIPAFQKCYIADGRTYSATIGSSGYHKIDFINTRLVGTASAAFTKGEVVTQATSAAAGIFDETVTVGAATWHLVYRTTTKEFNMVNVITGATSSTTLTPTAVVAPPHWLNWTASTGDLPDGGSNIGCLCFGRIFLNSMQNPHQWSCSRIFDALDWDTSQTDVGSATISQNTKAGEVGDVITAMIPYKDSYLTWGCANELWILRADPLQGGINTCISKSTGMFSPTSHCWDDQNNLYFLGSDGIYKLSSDAIINAQPPENITKQYIPRLVTALGLNRRTDRVVMAYDKQRYGIQVCVTQQDGKWAVNFWIDLRTGGLFPDTFPVGQVQSSLYYYNSYNYAERGLLLGGYDGYIRKYSESTKYDEGNNAINSFVTIGPFVSAKDGTRKKVSIKEVSLTMGEESNGVTVDIYGEESSDSLVNRIKEQQPAKTTKTLTGDNLQNTITDKVSAVATAIKISNSQFNESWSIEDTNIVVGDEGSLKK